MWFNKKSNITNLPIENINFPERDSKDEQEEWIWVEGYKGTDENMNCYGNFHYELNKEYDYSGNVSLCHSGFHFCLKLNDVYKYYGQIFKNRYFKCKAYVRKIEYEKYGTYDDSYSNFMWGMSSTKIDKLAAKKIILTKEVDFEEIKKTGVFSSQYPAIKIEEDYIVCKKIKGDYISFEFKRFVKEAVAYGYSETFARILNNKRREKGDSFYKYLEMMKAYKDEGLSPDMCAYLLLK